MKKYLRFCWVGHDLPVPDIVICPRMGLELDAGEVVALNMR